MIHIIFIFILWTGGCHSGRDHSHQDRNVCHNIKVITEPDTVLSINELPDPLTAEVRGSSININTVMHNSVHYNIKARMLLCYKAITTSSYECDILSVKATFVHPHQSPHKGIKG